MNMMNLIIIILSAIYFIIPAYIANGSGLVFGGGVALDMGKSLKDGRRIIGNGVTWRGFICGTITGTLAGGVLGYISQSIGITINQFVPNMLSTTVYGDVITGLILGFLLAFGALAGDAIGSFLKRRIGIERGGSAPILDQLDFVIVAIILSAFVVQLNIWFILVICLITLVIHLLTNSIAYLLGIKDVWY